MPEEASLGELVGILLRGGNGNDWPIPMTSEIGRTIYSNIGRLADVSAFFSEKAGLSDLGIHWVFGARSNEEPDVSALARVFEY